MANAAGILWEFQPTAGASTNGGGFDPSVVAPGTDHALAGTTFSRADIVIEADTTTITSAGDPFASDDDGNVIQITAGATATPGYYTILSEAGGVAQLDRSAGTAGGSVTAAIGPLDILTDAFLDGAAGTLGPQAGDTIYIKKSGEADMSIGAIAVAKDGTATEPIIIEGYNTTRGDDPTGANRPTIAAGANAFSFDNFWNFSNLILTTTQAVGLDADAACIVTNCKITQSSGTAGRTAISFGNTSAWAIDCELISTNGDAVQITGNGNHVDHCDMHDCDGGVNINTRASCSIRRSIIETCTTQGIEITTGSGTIIENNTIDNCATGIDVTTGHALRIRNNIISHNGTEGVTIATPHDSNRLDWNNWHGNTSDITGGSKGSNNTATDPDYEGANDFRSKSGAGVRDAGEGIRIGVGAAGTPDQGAWQSAGAAGGGGMIPEPKRYGLAGVN